MSSILILHEGRILKDGIVPYLQHLGYAVSCMEWGAVLKMPAVGPIDVMLIEMERPSLHSYKSLKKVRAICPTACIILIVEMLETEVVAAFLRAGVFDVLKGSLSLQRIEKTIRQGLKNKERLLGILDLSRSIEEANRKVAIERDRLGEWSHRLTSLHLLSESLVASLNLDEVIQSLMKGLSRVISYDVAGLYLKGIFKAWSASEARSPRLERLYEAVIKDGQGFWAERPVVTGGLIEQEGSEIFITLPFSTERVGLLRIILLDGWNLDDYQRRLLAMLATSLSLAVRNAESYQKIEDLAVRDELTSLLNRRALSGVLRDEFKRSQRHHTPLSLMMIDVDYFKAVNDTYGHVVGDQVLKELVAILQKGIREIDILARYGGEEFISILPGTAWEQALVVAQRMKTQVACAVFNTGGEAIHLTVSAGVSYLPHAEIGSPEDLIKRGDQALYLAKRGGRNQVALSPHTDAFIESGREVNE